jgi:hypothetical protein
VLRITAGARAEAPAPAPPPSADPARPAARNPDIQTPRPQPERPAVVIQEPEPVQEPAREESLFARKQTIDAQSALRTYREQPYSPLRRGEFYSSGFLTEGDELPFGRLLGTVTPMQIRNISERGTANLYATVGLLPPEGAQYQVGDSLLVVQVFPGPSGFGDIVHPTGVVRVTGMNGDEALASVVAVYGAIRNGQLVVPAERFVDGGSARAQPVADGVTGTVLTQRDVRELKQPQNVLFIDLGRQDGVARGDIFEIRRTPTPRPEASSTVDEPMALLQVVHVRERTATVRVLNVISPDIAPGTLVKQVGKLPT